MLPSSITTSLLINIILLLDLNVLPTRINAISDYDALVAAKAFSDNFLSPYNARQAAMINSTAFAVDVVGTVDLSTTFRGQELSTEYFFGLFVNVLNDSKSSDPSLTGTSISFLGSPISYEITSLMVENGMVSVSVIYDFYWTALNASYPQQIDAWLAFNDAGQITYYDATFRRWPWLTQIIVPQLAPLMGEELGIPFNSTNEDYIVKQYLANGICNTHQTYCVGANQQYDNFKDCFDFVSEIDLGYPWRMGENNTYCRALHMPMVPLRPNIHCEHIGPSGGDMCIPRDYRATVAGVFPAQNFLAPIPKTQESQYLVKNLSGFTNDSAISGLTGLAMSTTTAWDPTWYPIGFITYIFILYALAHIIDAACFRWIDIFPTLTTEHRKNVVQYMINILVTTIALAGQLVAARSFVGYYSLLELHCLRVAGVLISGLYLFELIYRLKMRIPMILHHILTVFAISLSVSLFEKTEDPSFIISSTVWLFQATTEQNTFVGLIGYRLDWNPQTVSSVLKVSAISTLVIKSVSGIGVLVVWAFKQRRTDQAVDTVYDVIVWIAGSGLLLTQLWGSYVIWTMARKIRRAGTLPSSDANKSNLDLYRQAALHDMRSIDDRTTMDLSVEKKGDHTDSTQSLPPLKYEGSTDHEGVTPDVALVSEYDFSSGSNSGWEPSRQVSKKGDEAPPVASGSHSAHQVGLN